MSLLEQEIVIDSRREKNEEMLKAFFFCVWKRTFQECVGKNIDLKLSSKNKITHSTVDMNSNLL